MAFCRNCGWQMEDGDQVCSSCGVRVQASTWPLVAPAAPAVAGGSSSVSGAWVGGQVALAIGSLMLMAGPFMAWVTAGFISGSGMQKTGNEAIMLVILGVVAATLALVSLVLRRSVLSIVPVVIGAIALGLSIYYYVMLRDDVAGFENELFTASMGSGVYVCLVGSALVFVGAVAGGLKRQASKL